LPALVAIIDPEPSAIDVPDFLARSPEEKCFQITAKARFTMKKEPRKTTKTKYVDGMIHG
jgi:hypothetical protein